MKLIDDTPKQQVRHEYLASYLVVREVGYEVRWCGMLLGTGSTPGKAWADAANRLSQDIRPQPGT